MTLQETLVDHHNETGARILIDLLLLHALARIPGSGVPGFSDFLARLFPGTSLIETTGQQTHMSDHVVRQCLEHLEKAAVLCREILGNDPTSPEVKKTPSFVYLLTTSQRKIILRSRPKLSFELF